MQTEYRNQGRQRLLTASWAVATVAALVPPLVALRAGAHDVVWTAWLFLAPLIVGLLGGMGLRMSSPTIALLGAGIIALTVTFWATAADSGSCASGDDCTLGYGIGGAIIFGVAFAMVLGSTFAGRLLIQRLRR
jgi:hypothetical protein